jgi:hypothetical protein
VQHLSLKSPLACPPFQHNAAHTCDLQDSTLDNSFSSCSFWQHLQGAEPLLDSSMGCNCPPHQQHLQGSRMGRHSTAGTTTHPLLAAPSPHGKLSLDSSCSSCKGQQQPILASPHTAAWRQEHMLLTAAAKAAGQQHPLTPFSANPSWQQGQKGGESKGGDHPEIRKIKERIRRRTRGEFQHHFSGEIFGGQQGHGRVFNTKFSKDLHVWLKLSLGF